MSSNQTFSFDGGKYVVTRNAMGIVVKNVVGAILDEVERLQDERDDAVTWIRVVGEEVESGGDRAQTLAAIRALKTRIDDLCKWMNRRVDVEQCLFDCASGKRPTLTAKQLFALALFLGTPPEQFKNAPQTLKQALEGAE